MCICCFCIAFLQQVHLGVLNVILLHFLEGLCLELVGVCLGPVCLYVFDLVVGAIFVCWGVGLVVAGACLCVCSSWSSSLSSGLVEFIEYDMWLPCTMGTGMLHL